MKTSYTVIIRKEHGDNYTSQCDCPLYRAIKEQLPEFGLEKVYGRYVVDKEHREWLFDSSCKTGWAHSRMEEIITDKIKEHKVTFTLEGYKPQEDIIDVPKKRLLKGYSMMKKGSFTFRKFNKNEHIQSVSNSRTRM